MKNRWFWVDTRTFLASSRSEVGYILFVTLCQKRSRRHRSFSGNVHFRTEIRCFSECEWERLGTVGQ